MEGDSRAFERLHAVMDAPAPGIVQDQPQAITNLHLVLYRYRTDVSRWWDIHTRIGRRGFMRWMQERGNQQMLERQGGSGPPVPLPIRDDGVNSIGYAHSEMGIAEDMRATVHALRSRGLPVAIHPIAAGNGLPELDRSLSDLVDLRMPYRTSLFHLGGLMQLLLLRTHGESLFANRYNIGVWAWELERWPSEAAFCCWLNHEIWAMSAFVRDALAETDVPVRVMPPTIAVPDVEPASLAQYGVREGAFTYLVVFDAGSSIRRKNPLGAIAAFRYAFPSGENVALLIKVMGARRAGPEWVEVEREAAADPRIVLIDEVMPRDAMFALLRACDCFVSLHRSEGFGRCIAEAMLHGKPCIATNYSGNTDFCRDDNCYLVDYTRVAVRSGEYPLVFDTPNHWADPSVEHAAQQMREVHTDRERRERIADAARRTIVARYSEPVTSAACAARLAEVQQDPPAG